MMICAPQRKSIWFVFFFAALTALGSNSSFYSQGLFGSTDLSRYASIYSGGTEGDDTKIDKPKVPPLKGLIVLKDTSTIRYYARNSKNRFPFHTIAVCEVKLPDLDIADPELANVAQASRSTANSENK